MTTSLVLLFALQALWLGNSYERAYFDLRGETTRYLRDALFAVRDSSLLKNIEALPPDSMITGRGFTFTERTDSPVTRRHRRNIRDGQVQVYISSRPGSDTAKLLLRSVASQFQEGKLRGNSTFMVRFSGDSLSTDSIKAQFGRTLAAAGRDMPFQLLKANNLPSFAGIRKSPTELSHMILGGGPDESDRHFSVIDSRLRTDWVRLEPAQRYAAILTDIRPLLLKEIAPQILFSLFLTLLTCCSFVVMYRSILSQQRLMAIKNDFISNITHELKTPIATVSVALEALKNFRGMEDPKLTAEYLDIAQLELGRLSILTDKVLTTSLFDERGVTFDFEPVDLDATAAMVISSMKLVLDKQKAQVSYEKTGSRFEVSGSSLHLTNVVYNLLDNAIKYSPAGPVIAVSLEETTDTVVLKVKDQGLGIPSDFQKKIFEKFFRMPTGDVHNIKGHGLGLSYVDQVVKGHGGTIEVQSEPGKGSTFMIRLPKRQG